MTINEASGGDIIPADLFQILKDDAALNVSKFGKLISGHNTEKKKKKSVFIPISKKSNAKKCFNWCTIVIISHASKVMLKILQARLQQYVNQELPDADAGFRKSRRISDQIAYIHGIMEKV